MRTQESGEDYLETILLLQKKQGYVRSIDIANELAYTKPSISRAMKILKENNLITMDKNKIIRLTEQGEEKAQEIHDRHCMVAQCLMITLGVDEETADHDACRIEHVISDKTFDKIKIFIENYESEK